MPEITCRKCGARISDEFRYCFNCGNPLDASIGPKTRSETRQGAMVGGFVGFLYGIFTAVQSYFTWFPVYMAYLGSRMASEPAFANNPQFSLSFFNTINYFVLVMEAPMSALLGCVLGVIFVKFRERIPGSSIIRKSVVFGLILLAISLIIHFRPQPQIGVIHLTMEQYKLNLVSDVCDLALFPILGWLFGYLLERRMKLKGF